MSITPKFNLRWLLLAVFGFAVLFAVATQAGMVRCEFTVTENKLFLNEDGLVEGDLLLAADGWEIVCQLSKVDLPELIDVKPKSKSSIRYRASEIGPLKKQQPVVIFLSQHLGIHPDYVVGFVFFEGSMEVVINGQL